MEPPPANGITGSSDRAERAECESTFARSHCTYIFLTGRLRQKQFELSHATRKRELVNFFDRTPLRLIFSSLSKEFVCAKGSTQIVFGRWSHFQGVGE
jgi:hypothetical protein